MPNKIFLENTLELVSRIELSVFFCVEFASIFGASVSDQKIIKEGMKQMFFKHIIVEGIKKINKKKFVVLSAKITIDNDYQAFLFENYSDEEVESKKYKRPISEWLDLWEEVAKKIHDNVTIDYHRVLFTYRDDIYNNQDELLRVRKLLGLSPADTIPTHPDSKPFMEDNSPAFLEEISVGIQSIYHP